MSCSYRDCNPESRDPGRILQSRNPGIGSVQSRDYGIEKSETATKSDEMSYSENDIFVTFRGSFSIDVLYNFAVHKIDDR